MRKKIINIDIATDKCSACGRCAAVCPNGIFTIKKHEGKLHSLCVWSSKCNACGLCTVICPKRAITLEVENLEPFNVSYI